MKNNKELLAIYLGGNMNVGTLTPSAIYDIMASAQIEALKELVKREWNDTNNMYMGGTGTKHKTIDEIALELIKEIES